MSAVPPLSAQETALFQAVSNAALVYMLMLRLRRPLGAREIGDILGLHEQTAARYLRRLAKLNLIARSRSRQGYVLLGGRQLILGEPGQAQSIPVRGTRNEPPERSDQGDSHLPARDDALHEGAELTNFSQSTADTTLKTQYPTTTSFNDINSINLRDSEVVVDQTVNKTQIDTKGVHSAVWEELIMAGIGANGRTRTLVCQPHITPEYVKAHRLKLIASGKSGPKWAGLLVTILESGEPAPELNPNGHLADCDCQECHAYEIARSWEDL